MQKKFSYPLVVAELPQAEQHYRLRADESDCRYLAEVLKVPEVMDFEADLQKRSCFRTAECQRPDFGPSKTGKRSIVGVV